MPKLISTSSVQRLHLTFALGAGMSLMACASGPLKIPVTPAVAPPKGWTVTSGLTIGDPTALTVTNDIVYVAGTDGVAGLSADGKVLWQTKLSPLGNRQLGADAAGVVWTGYNLTGIAPHGAFTEWLGLGENADLRHFENAACGALAPNGNVLWQKELPGTSVSAPGLNGELIAFTTERSIEIIQRKDGANVSALESSQKGDYKVESNNMRLRPMASGAGFAAVNNQWIVSIDAKGKEVDRLRNKGDLVGLGRYGDDVLVGGGLVVHHYSGPVGYEATDWVVHPDGSIKKLRSRDTTPTTDVATIEGQRYALTNFVVYADNASGGFAWKDVNEKGGLFPGRARGTRKLGSYDFFTRVSSGAFLAGGKGVLLIPSHADRREPDDQIAVLNTKNGQGMGHWQASGTILDIANVGDSVAVIDGRGVAFTQLPGVSVSLGGLAR